MLHLHCLGSETYSLALNTIRFLMPSDLNSSDHLLFEATMLWNTAYTLPIPFPSLALPSRPLETPIHSIFRPKTYTSFLPLQGLWKKNIYSQISFTKSGFRCSPWNTASALQTFSSPFLKPLNVPHTSSVLTLPSPLSNFFRQINISLFALEYSFCISDRPSASSSSWFCSCWSSAAIARFSPVSTWGFKYLYSTIQYTNVFFLLSAFDAS